MKLEEISSKTLNYSYLTGKKATLTIAGLDEVKKVLVFYIDEKQLCVSVANDQSFKKGTSCCIELLYKEKLLQVNSFMKSFEDGILYINMPRKVSLIQQRDDVRIDCNIKCSIERFTTGKIKNISAGGCYIDLDTPINLSVFNQEHFKLCFTINHSDYRLTSTAIELTDKYMRVQFIDLHDDIKETLSLYCYNKSAELYRRSKDER